MARTIAELPKGTRMTDCRRPGGLSKTFPLRQVEVVGVKIAQGRVLSSRWRRAGAERSSRI